MAMNEKQKAAIERLTLAIVGRNLDPQPVFEVLEEGSSVYMMATGWPNIQIGRQGGISLPEIRSYPEPFAAAVNGDTLLAKQNARDGKKAPAAPPAPAAEVKKEEVGEAQTEGEEVTEEEDEEQNEPVSQQDVDNALAAVEAAAQEQQ